MRTEILHGTSAQVPMNLGRGDGQTVVSVMIWDFGEIASRHIQHCLHLLLKARVSVPAMTTMMRFVMRIVQDCSYMFEAFFM